jgi:hypothetical protein
MAFIETITMQIGKRKHTSRTSYAPQFLMAHQPVGVCSIDRSFVSSRGNSSGLVS